MKFWISWYAHHRDRVRGGGASDKFEYGMCDLCNMSVPMPQALVQRIPNQQVANMHTSSAHETRHDLHSPCWITGVTIKVCDNEEYEYKWIICAAIIADDIMDAKEQIYEIYDIRPNVLEFLSVDQKSEDWNPFSEVFTRSDTMQWP